MNKMIPHPNWVEINLDALRENLMEVRKLIEPNVKILLPVKAHAYGHGILACSLLAQKEGVDMLGVAHSFEAIPLRKSGVHIPILVMGPLLEESFEEVIEYNLTPTITSIAAAKAFQAFLKKKKTKHKVHLKVDTGMSRYGFDFQSLDLVKCFDFSQLEIEGLYSHMANGENSLHFSNRQQIERFQNVLHRLPRRPEFLHLANSATLMNFPDSHYNMVRPGLISYGYSPFENRLLPEHFQGTMRLKATIRQISEIRSGQGVSYGHNWTAPKNTVVASVAIGYGDGIFRSSKEALFYVNGQACPVLGNICMDTTLIDVSKLKNPKVGTEVHIINREVSQEIAIERVAQRADTIAYEQSCRMARRLFRIYQWKGQLRRWDEIKEDLGWQG